MSTHPTNEGHLPASEVPGVELSDKVALVTGGARNIGRSISLALAAGGATVAVNTRASREDAESLVQQIEARGPVICIPGTQYKVLVFLARHLPLWIKRLLTRDVYKRD